MEDKIKRIVLDTVKADNFDRKLMNSYSLNRKANAVWQIIILYGIKTGPGEKRNTKIVLGKNIDLLHKAVGVMENIFEENEENGIEMQLDDIPKNKKGW